MCADVAAHFGMGRGLIQSSNPLSILLVSLAMGKVLQDVCRSKQPALHVVLLFHWLRGVGVGVWIKTASAPTFCTIHVFGNLQSKNVSLN